MITAAAAYCWEMDRVFRRDGNPPRRPAQPAPAGRPHGAGAPCIQASELQASLARGIGQRLDAAVVAVAGTVEGDLLDARGLRLLGDDAADPGGGFGVLAALQAVADV